METLFVLVVAILAGFFYIKILKKQVDVDVAKKIVQVKNITKKSYKL
ncbi:hypothetical protein O6B97_03405 [Campylobacter ureolyticus]|nr:hypothetical protein [Campylobacter ureolyticus]MCZ6173341.1 hypothetical protein [Campylobacter ureolyticus]MCZ6186138.1 hypothetical protein [Campylobacter ureolyticus]